MSVEVVMALDLYRDAIRRNAAETCTSCKNQPQSLRVQQAAMTLYDALRADVQREDSSPLSETAA